MAVFPGTELAGQSRRQGNCYGPPVASRRNSPARGEDAVQTGTAALLRDGGGGRPDHTRGEAAASRAAGALTSARATRSSARREAARSPRARRHADVGGRGVLDE